MDVLRKLIRYLIRALGVVLGLVSLAYLMLLAINWRDQPLSELVRGLQESHQADPAIGDAENGYVFMLGFTVGPSESPRNWGARRIEWGRSRAEDLHADLSARPPGETFNLETARSPAVMALARSCTNDSAKCLWQTPLRGETRNTWLRSESWLLDRYIELLGHPYWSEANPLDVRMPLPSFYQAIEGQKLLFAQALHLAEQGNAAGVGTLLEADFRFWRRAQESSNYLLSKMISLMSLRRHFLYANAVFRELPAEALSDAIPADWNTPISDTERSMQRCFGAEALYALNSTEWFLAQDPDQWLGIDEEAWSEIVVAAWPLIRPLLQPVDLGNRHAARLSQIASEMDVPYQDLPSAFARIRSVEARRFADREFGLYNIVGKWLLDQSYEPYLDYGPRTSDLEGFRRVALVIAHLRIQQIPGEKRASAVQGSVLRNPYTDEPLKWNESSQAVVFEGLGPGERGRFSLSY